VNPDAIAKQIPQGGIGRTRISSTIKPAHLGTWLWAAASPCIDAIRYPGGYTWQVILEHWDGFDEERAIETDEDGSAVTDSPALASKKSTSKGIPFAVGLVAIPSHGGAEIS